MLGQHVYIEPGTGVNTEGLHLMTAYIVDADGKEPYVWVANKKDRLEKRNVKLGAYDEEQDTWEITEGLKETDYIVWPDGECKEGDPAEHDVGAHVQHDGHCHDQDKQERLKP